VLSITQGTTVKVLNAFAVVAALGLANMACAQSQSSGSDAPSMSATWVSAIVGMKVTTPDGVSLGRVKDVVVDGYGRAIYAIIGYGGVMGLGNKYAAVPWTTVAEMLQNDRLLIDRWQLENAPMLSGAKPESANTSWRRAADSYWRGKVAASPALVTAPAVPDTIAPPP
jgi:sporulation protein YlmC with PRC-barrel domain